MAYEPRKYIFKDGPVSALEKQRDALHERIANLRPSAKKIGPRFSAMLTSCSNSVQAEQSLSVLKGRARQITYIEGKIDNALKYL
jgi:hypothetical protein